MNFRSVKFVTSSPDLSYAHKDNKPAILMVGRSNVGKSSLINALTGQKIAFSSKKAGKTKLLNYFLIEDKFFLVDSPGYGSTSFATMSTIQFSSMMEGYVKEPSLKAIALLIDLRRTPGEDDKAFYRYLQQTGKPLLVILTKMDTMNQSEKAKARKIATELGFTQFLESDLSIKSLDKIRTVLSSYGK